MDNLPNVEMQKTQLAQEIGFAVELWSKCELMLPYIAASASDNGSIPYTEGLVSFAELSHTHQVLHTAINSVVSFPARMDIADNLMVESDLNAKLGWLWDKLSKRVRKKYKSRHQIAHFIFVEEQFGGDEIAVKVEPFASSIITMDATYLTLADIKAKRQQFLEIYESLVWFHREMEFLKGRLPNNPLPMNELIGRFFQEKLNQNPPTPE